ncbi:MAG: aminotransferase class I/II-fold pyridoxal phosphate-dependent enzyme [Chloroflexota bacterium]|nr:aminotransferase class I/II-fold pyridoxal phosphate-dependent enzyme [Chloroflexota bacterium]
MDPRAAEKVQGFGPSVFAEMSRLAVEHGAVNLGQGFPDFPGPEFVKDAAKRAIDEDLNQYAISHGHPRLRTALARDFASRFGREIDPDREISVASGATEVIFDAIQACIGPGDALVAFEPFYDSYAPATTMAGGEFRPVRLEPPDWSFDPDELRQQCGHGACVLLLNTPHNPTGKVFTRPELELIAEIANERDLIVLSDEVYDRILFHGCEHIPIWTLPGMWERTLTINSTGKTFSMTGWKVGYAIGPAGLNAALRVVHQFVTFASATPFQEAMAVALEVAPELGYYDQLAREYDERRIALERALTEAGLPTLPIGGSYFLMADFSHLPYATDVEFCRWLVTERGVAAVPPSAFYVDPATAPRLARFCFAKKISTLEEAGRRLRTESASHI